MSIVFDGIRARQRKGVSKSLMVTCRMLGLPAMFKVVDGFKFKVSAVMDDLDAGYVVSPAGFVVAMSSADGKISTVSADYWLGGVNGHLDANSVHIPTVDTDDLDMAVVGPGSTYKWPKVDEFLSSTYDPPVPSLTPLVGEMYALSLSAVDVVTEDVLGVPTEVSKANVSVLASLYCGAVVDTSVGVYIGSALAPPHCVIPHAADKGFSVFTAFDRRYYASSDNKWNMAYQCLFDGAQSAVGVYKIETIAAGLPSDVGDRVSNKTALSLPPVPVATIGMRHDSSSKVLTVHLIDASDVTFNDPTPGDPFDDPYADYRYMLSIYQWEGSGGVILTVPALEALCTLVFGSTDLGNLQKLFGYPCTPFTESGTPIAALDTVLVTLGPDAIVSWTRAYGAVMFHRVSGALKLPATSFKVPDLAKDTPGVRPTMSHAGNDLYFCACDDTQNHRLVKGIFTGSPLTAWTALSMPTIETESGTQNVPLLYVRPVVVSTDSVVLLGITGTIGVNPEIDSEERVLSCRMAVYAGGAWNFLSILPFQDFKPEDVRWSATFYGDDEPAISMAKYPQQQPPVCGGMERAVIIGPPV